MRPGESHHQEQRSAAIHAPRISQRLAAGQPAKHHRLTINHQPASGVSMEKNNVSRRRFMYGVATVAGATFAGPYLIRAAGVNKEKIRVACVGVGGKGDGDSDQAHLAGGQLMALCDVDEGTLNGKAKKYPTAKLY